MKDRDVYMFGEFTTENDDMKKIVMLLLWGGTKCQNHHVPQNTQREYYHNRKWNLLASSLQRKELSRQWTFLVDGWYRNGLVFSSFIIGSLLSVKAPIPCGLRSNVVYRFSCSGCNACFHVSEHLITDKTHRLIYTCWILRAAEP